MPLADVDRIRPPVLTDAIPPSDGSVPTHVCRCGKLIFYGPTRLYVPRWLHWRPPGFRFPGPTELCYAAVVSLEEATPVALYIPDNIDLGDN